ncbi:hypothetical protein O181_108725 [Austropuccinia psidii MF-1]|uniref:Uncharacterized protein n=1 Tax=Austropuccinia psidii MF-1 TaxID=1389203 RepID=A0A9Q3JSY7_9BASI|nr:hypothetical protein [Austropuccinia psidii MF-1]
MNVSGLNIDVGNPKAPTKSTWSIPNISVTPIPPNPTNTQMHVSEGPEGKPQISSNANPQSKFPCEFLLNPGWNTVASQDPFGQSKQPTLNIPSESQVHVGNEKQVDGDELYESSPLVHKEKVTGHHHPCAFKPRMGHAISSRERIVDDEDENTSLTQNERNDEPRRDNFTVHEQGTQSNSEFTHPPMGLAQNMVEQSEFFQG